MANSSSRWHEDEILEDERCSVMGRLKKIHVGGRKKHASVQWLHGKRQMLDDVISQTEMVALHGRHDMMCLEKDEYYLTIQYKHERRLVRHVSRQSAERSNVGCWREPRNVAARRAWERASGEKLKGLSLRLRSSTPHHRDPARVIHHPISSLTIGQRLHLHILNLVLHLPSADVHHLT